jgi:hypothetical protein
MAVVSLLAVAVPALLPVAVVLVRVDVTLPVVGLPNAATAVIAPGALLARTMISIAAVVTALSTETGAAAPFLPTAMTVTCARVRSKAGQHLHWVGSNFMAETPPPPHHEDDLDTADLAD